MDLEKTASIPYVYVKVHLYRKKILLLISLHIICVNIEYIVNIIKNTGVCATARDSIQRTQLAVTFSLDTMGSILATGVLTRNKYARTKQQIYGKKFDRIETNPTTNLNEATIY